MRMNLQYEKVIYSGSHKLVVFVEEPSGVEWCFPLVSLHYLHNTDKHLVIFRPDGTVVADLEGEDKDQYTREVFDDTWR